MRDTVDLRAWLLLLPLLLGACDSSRTRGLTPTGPAAADGVVVESATLETIGERVRPGTNPTFDQRECHVRGQIRNDGPRPLSVALTFAAFDHQDAVMARATSPHTVVEAGGRTQYRALLIASGGCEKVHRFEITRIETEPV